MKLKKCLSTLALVLTVMIFSQVSVFASTKPVPIQNTQKPGISPNDVGGPGETDWTEATWMRQRSNRNLQVITITGVTNVLLSLIPGFGATAKSIYGLASSVVATSIATGSPNIYYEYRYYYKPSGIYGYAYYVKEVCTFYPTYDYDITTCYGSQIKYYYTNTLY